MKIALCDNNQKEIGNIEKVIHLHTSQQYEFDFFSNGEKLIRHLNEIGTSYNIYFISIEMTETDSVALAQQIRAFDVEALIIFVSDDIKRMPDVFKVQAFDYLVKPISSACLLETMDRARNYFNAIHAYFEFSFNRKLVVLPMNEIVYIAKSGRVAYIHTTERIYKTYLTMAEIIAKLDKHLFARIHGSYVVNLNYIVEIAKNEIFVKQFEDGLQQENNLSLPMSRTFKEELKVSYATFLKARKSL
ncbi:response regulator transcription factor [Enterococcus ureilyticus]|uniref:LytR/AlgR family response regulator transcription factor n=1 Tax=Enterococcus ureilyticus TaxID=1131292 RepID=UPI001A911456|nr:LytTR family DNA-binding domain-containing protein [Enterococcus ureilyticus]MBO0447528.1 response regulator transcription factor [Enterococcus ureilyticus]